MSIAVGLLPSLAHVADRWGAFYNHHGAWQTAVSFAHIGGLLVAGGLAIASDRMTLRALRGRAADRRRTLEELHAVHAPVLVALALVLASGVLLAAADLRTFITSPLYWAKLTLVVLLLANGAALTRVERRLLAIDGATPDAVDVSRDWKRLRFVALASIALWLATSFAGTLLVNAGT